MRFTEFIKTRVLLNAMLLIVVGWPMATGYAASSMWATDADGNWSDTTKWSGGTIADGVDSTASFTNAISGTRTVTLDTDRAIGNLAFNDTGFGSTNTWTLSGSKTLTLDMTGGFPAITTTTAATISTVLAGNDGFSKFGTQYLALTAANTYGGTTTISRGTLKAVDGVGLPASTNLDLNNGGSYETSGVFSRGLGTGAGQIQWTGDGGFSARSGSMAIRLSGGTSTVTWGSGSFVPSGQNLFLDGLVDFQNDIDLAGGDRTIRVGTGGSPKISGTISNGNLIKVSTDPHFSSGPLILTGNNTYGNTTFGIGDLTAGTLQIGNGGTTGTLGTGTVSFDGDLAFDRSNSMTVANTITGRFTARIVQQGLGTTILSGDLSAFSGSVDLVHGTLVLDYGSFDSSKMGDRSSLSFSSGNLQLVGGTHQEIVGQTNIYGPASISRISGSATIRLNGILVWYGGYLDISEDNLADTGNRNVNGAIPGVTVNGKLAKNATNSANGKFVALADADYVNVPRLGGQIGGGLANIRIVNGGTAGPVTMPGTGTTPINSITQSATDGPVDINVGVGKTLRLGSYGTILAPAGASAMSITGGTLTAGGTENRDGTIAIQNFADVTIGSVISDYGGIPWGPVVLAKQGPGRLILTASNTYTRGTYITGGTLQVGGGGSTGSVSGNVINGGSLSFNRSNGITFADVISGPGTLSQDGTGMLTLTNANTYSGGTTVNAGTLFVNNVSGSGTGTGPVAVNSSTAVGGTGTVAGAVTNNGMVAPGSSVGTLRINSNYTQSAVGSLQIELASGSSFDRLVVDGTAALGGTLEVLLLGGYLPRDGTQFDFLDWGSRSGSFATVELPPLPSGLSWDSSQLDTFGRLDVVGLAGDFDEDGAVDAADYVTWRKNGGTQGEYNLWRANFGRTLASGAIESTAVPGPSSLMLASVVVTLLCALIGNRRSCIALRR